MSLQVPQFAKTHQKTRPLISAQAVSEANFEVPQKPSLSLLVPSVHLKMGWVPSNVLGLGDGFWAEMLTPLVSGDRSLEESGLLRFQFNVVAPGSPSLNGCGGVE